jgi:hypothetical protein
MMHGTNMKILADILALKFYSKPNRNKYMKVWGVLVDMRGAIGRLK